MNDATRTTMQAAPRHSASPRIEAIAAWLIAALILAGGGIVARLIGPCALFGHRFTVGEG